MRNNHWLGIVRVLLLSLLLAGCNQEVQQEAGTLRQARQGFSSKVAQQNGQHDPVDIPPAGTFRLVRYQAQNGNLPAYLTPDPGDGKRHPAIVWITGGDCNSIGDVWSPASPDNDQTASAYRQAGIVMMFPSLRGGNQNPGLKEGFLGEVNDVEAATDYLAAQPYVDPKRIYLGGHSTGGTLTLLVSECSSKYRAVFSFGPVADVSGYGESSGFLPFDTSDSKEVKLRSPGYWLASITSPTWVFEGTSQGNIGELRKMAKSNKNPKAHFVEMEGSTHFSVLAPTNEMIAKKILEDTGDTCNITFTEGK